MTGREFNHILNSIKALSPEQMRRLRRELDSELALSGPLVAAAADETVFEVLNRVGLIGCIKGAPRTPTDLSTNPKHMEGFGRE
jgi:hypothetical protein